MQLNHILLYTDNVTTAKDFYQKLGFDLIHESDEQVQFKIGDIIVQCFDEQKVFFKQDSEKPEKGVGVFLHLEVEDVDAEFNRLVAAGLKPSGEPTDRPWGNREFAIKDPSGYRWVFYRAIEG